ncbi:MAG: hypothetical protein ACK559_40025, partial [bacterium]
MALGLSYGEKPAPGGTRGSTCHSVQPASASQSRKRSAPAPRSPQGPSPGRLVGWRRTPASRIGAPEAGGPPKGSRAGWAGPRRAGRGGPRDLMARCGPPPVLLIGATARPDPRGCLERLGGPMGGSVEQKSIVAGVRAAERR